jgi:hypothetical protein
LLVQLAQRKGPFILLIFALIMVAGFESSTWVGGITFPAAAIAISLVTILKSDWRNRGGLVLHLAVAGTFAIGLASPLLYDQFMMAAMRAGDAPITLEPYSVLGYDLPEPIDQIVDLPAFWLIFLVVEFPAFYLTGAVTMTLFLRGRDLAEDRKPVVLAFAILAVTSLCVSWLLVSTLTENNDLGWRGVLPAVMLLIIFAAIGLSRALRKPASLAAIAALALVVGGLPKGAMDTYGNIIAEPQRSSKLFAATPAMWEPVRSHSQASDRIANNPLFLQELTPWPINISWALLSNRRSCYAGSDYVTPFSSLTQPRREEVDAQFTRIFSGNATSDDLWILATQYDCRVMVVSVQDGAWDRDPFASHPAYQLVESDPAAWRIYEIVDSNAHNRAAAGTASGNRRRK